MKKVILGLFTIALGTLAGFTANGQAFNTTDDTVSINLTYNTGSVDLHNDITATTAPVYIKWFVTSTDFAGSWATPSAINICDNYNCYTNSNNDMLDGKTYISTTPYNPGVPGIFKATFNLGSASPGDHYVTIRLRDTISNETKDITFRVSKWTTSVPNVAKSEEVTLYPNPARDELNVVFDQNDNIKNIAVYNVIGKAIIVYRVSGGSAKLDIDKIPNGVYFIRLSNSKGQVVSTKRFTKQ